MTNTVSPTVDEPAIAPRPMEPSATLLPVDAAVAQYRTVGADDLEHLTRSGLWKLVAIGYDNAVVEWSEWQPQDPAYVECAYSGSRQVQRHAFGRRLMFVLRSEELCEQASALAVEFAGKLATAYEEKDRIGAMKADADGRANKLAEQLAIAVERARDADKWERTASVHAIAAKTAESAAALAREELRVSQHAQRSMARDLDQMRATLGDELYEALITVATTTEAELLRDRAALALGGKEKTS